MSELRVTLIDVGWGDSILIESLDENGKWHYGLVDSNDTTYLRSSFIFLKKHFKKRKIDLSAQGPIFEFVLLSHGHDDHGQGLKGIIKEFGTEKFWYPKSTSWSSQTNLLRYANRSTRVGFHQSLDKTKIVPALGEVDISILWPEYNRIDRHNENNNSVVLALELGGVSFVLTGDAEEEVWSRIASQLPANTRFFKVPHHGSVNGTFDSQGNETWSARLTQSPALGISSHPMRFSHPDKQVIDLFRNKAWPLYRTDENYHLTFMTDGTDVKVKYSHV